MTAVHRLHNISWWKMRRSFVVECLPHLASAVAIAILMSFQFTSSFSIESTIIAIQFSITPILIIILFIIFFKYLNENIIITTQIIECGVFVELFTINLFSNILINSTMEIFNQVFVFSYGLLNMIFDEIHSIIKIIIGMVALLYIFFSYVISDQIFLSQQIVRVFS